MKMDAESNAMHSLHRLITLLYDISSNRLSVRPDMGQPVFPTSTLLAQTEKHRPSSPKPVPAIDQKPSMTSGASVQLRQR